MNWYKTAQIEQVGPGTKEEESVENIVLRILNSNTLSEALNIFLASGKDKEKLRKALSARYNEELDAGYQNIHQLRDILKVFHETNNLSNLKKLKDMVICGFRDFLNVNKDYGSSGFISPETPFLPQNLRNDLRNALPIFFQTDNDVRDANINAVCHLLQFPNYNFLMSRCFGGLGNNSKIQECKEKQIDKYWVGCAIRDLEAYFVTAQDLKIIKKVREQLNDEENERVVLTIVELTKKAIDYFKKKSISNDANKTAKEKEELIENCCNNLMSYFTHRLGLLNAYNDDPRIQMLIRQIKRGYLALKLKAHEMKRHLGFD